MNVEKFHYNSPEKLSFPNIDNLTFNGVHYIFLDSHSPKVTLLYKDFNLFKTIPLHRSYSNICFDNIQKCYWAISNNDASVIYKLNRNFSEINKITIKNTKPFSTIGLSFNYYNNSLWLLFSNCIGYIKKGTNTIHYISNKDSALNNTAILALPQCTLISYRSNCNQFIEIFTAKNCNYLFKCFPEEYIIEDITLTSFSSNKTTHSSTHDICLLLSKKCSSTRYIMKCSIKFYKNHIPKFICENSENINHNFCDISKDCLNYECFSNCSCNNFNCNVKYEIMHSIALEEAAIAHILNAEGEKIQKAVACSNNIDKLLCINESVKHTIIHITQLETQLYLKLLSLQDNNCNPKCDITRNCLLDKKTYL